MKILKKLGLLAAVAGLLGAGAAVLGSSPSVGVKATGDVPSSTETEPSIARIWLNRNGHWERENDKWQLVVGENPIESSDAIRFRWDHQLDGTAPVYLVYFDVPVSQLIDGSTIAFKSSSIDEAGETIEGATIEVKYNAGDNAQVYYPYEDKEDNNIWKVSQGIAAQDWDGTKESQKIEASEVAKYVLAPYGSCSTDKNVGVGALDKLINTWIHTNEDVWYLKGDLGGNTITEWNGTEVDAYVKYQQMEATYSTISNSEGANDSAVPATIAGFFVVIGIAAVGGLTGAIIYRRRRTAE